MPEQSSDDPFIVLRATIDSFTAMPAVVLVTSALAGDGKSTVARGLARAFADVNVEVALVNANTERPSKIVCTEKNLVTVSYPSNPGAVVRAADVTPPSLDRLRERFGVTIIDAGTIAEHGTTLQVARIADAVILAVRHGRRRVKADEQGIAMLSRVGARVIGVVPVTGILPVAGSDRQVSSLRAFLRWLNA